MPTKKEFGELAQMKNEYCQVMPPPEGKEAVRRAVERARKENRRRRNLRRVKSWGAGIAAAAALVVLIPNISSSAAYAMSNVPVLGAFVEAVTFREYEAYSADGRYEADVQVPELVAADGLPLDGAQLDLINEEIEEIAQDMIQEFEINMGSGEGYGQLIIRYEILSSTEDYFSLKLMTYNGAGSGYEKDYYYTLDLKTGKQLSLGELFPEGADFITPISENIKEQMRSRMEADENVTYWVDLDVAGPDAVQAWSFETIAEDQSFYIDEDGRLIITFSEGDVAPMYMGCDQFVIPAAVVNRIK